MNFSICIIAKNEANTLPRCIESLKKFMDKGGVVCILDTGSTDGTANLARSLGCKVEEVGEKFITKISWAKAKIINQTFLVDNELMIVKENDRLFDFASARNYCAEMAPTDMVIAVDADEYFTALDLDKVSKLVEDGVEQFETHFIFAHDQYGKPAIQFIQSRFYNKKKLKYTGIVHEVLTGDAKRMPLPKDVYMLEHKQEGGKAHRSNYLIGLALDCFEHQEKDRQSHYFARELLYTGRLNSAIKEFKRHITMGAWKLEAAQSMVYIGDCYGRLNKPDEQVEWYNKAFYFDSNRREPLIKMAEFYKHNQNFKATAAYAAASLEIPLTDYYSNNSAHYAQRPHELLYWANGWYGDIEGARHHIKKALEYQPLNPIYLRDLRYYYDLPKVSIIIPTLGREEGLKRCLDSIKTLNYPKEKIEIIIIRDEPRLGVPLRVKEGYEQSGGDYICYAANDMEFTPDSLILAIWDSMTQNKRLVAFDTGVRGTGDDYICEHFIIKRSLVEELGEIFDTRLKHYCTDTLLWKRAERLGEAMMSKGTVKHYHYSRIGSGIKMDEINILAGESVEEDRKMYNLLVNSLEKERVINRLALPITRACNRRCPECPAVERRAGFSRKNISIEELREVGGLIGPIQKIEITGGEPSLHPEFEWISEHIHDLFDCKDIMLLTNGWLFQDSTKLPLLLNYDRVYITHYTEKFAELYDEEPNTELCNKVRDFMIDYPEKGFWMQTMDSHVPLENSVSEAEGCIFDYDKGNMISYFDGELYGCCTAWQLEDRGKGIPLTKDWREHLEEIELPCNKCFLGEKVYKEELVGCK